MARADGKHLQSGTRIMVQDDQVWPCGCVVWYKDTETVFIFKVMKTENPLHLEQYWMIAW